MPLGGRLERRVPDPVDVAPDRARLFQVHVGQDRADVSQAQPVQRLRVRDVSEDRGADGLVLPELLGLDPVRRHRRGLVDVCDDFVEQFEGHGAVLEHLVPRRGPSEMLLEPDDRLRESLDSRNVNPILRGLPTRLGGLVCRVQSECGVETLERVVEASKMEEGDPFAVPRCRVAGIEPQSFVVRLHGLVVGAGPLLRETAHVPQVLLPGACGRRAGQRIRCLRELFLLDLKEAFPAPRVAVRGIRLNRSLERHDGLRGLPERLERLPLPRQEAGVVRGRFQGEFETGERLRGAARPQEAETFRAERVVMVRILLEHDREHGERIVEVSLGREAHRLSAQELEIVVIQNEAILEQFPSLSHPAGIEQNPTFRPERGAIARVQA